MEKLRSKAVELAEKQLAPEMDKIKLDNILVNFLDPLLVIQKEYEYTTVNIKVTPSRSRATSCSFRLNINIPQPCLHPGYFFSGGKYRRDQHQESIAKKKVQLVVIPDEHR